VAGARPSSAGSGRHCRGPGRPDLLADGPGISGRLPTRSDGSAGGVRPGAART